MATMVTMPTTLLLAAGDGARRSKGTTAMVLADETSIFGIPSSVPGSPFFIIFLRLPAFSKLRSGVTWQALLLVRCMCPFSSARVVGANLGPVRLTQVLEWLQYLGMEDRMRMNGIIIICQGERLLRMQQRACPAHGGHLILTSKLKMR